MSVLCTRCKLNKKEDCFHNICHMCDECVHMDQITADKDGHTFCDSCVIDIIDSISVDSILRRNPHETQK